MPRKKNPVPQPPRLITDTNAYEGSFTAVHFVTAGAFSSLNGQPQKLTFPAGFRVEGPINHFQLSNGAVVAYQTK